MTAISTTIAPLPNTYLGCGTIKHLSDIIRNFGSHNILLIADPTLVKLDVHGPIVAALKELGCNYSIYTDLIPEPTLETGQKLVDFTRQGNYDLLIGFGGGSVLDMAKIAAVLADNPGDVAEYLNISGSKKPQQKGKPKIIIPTTSGTGAEVTNIGVLALEKTKDVVVHNYLIADVAIVDPLFTLSVPPAVTAATGADALTHAIEAFLSVNANPYSDALALEAVKLIGASLKSAVREGNNKEARTKMAYGSYLAGLAFFNAGVGAVHALAYPLGGQFHIAHGDSNAVLMPYVLKYISSACAQKLETILYSLTVINEPLTTDQAVNKCIDVLSDLLRDIGIPETLQQYNIPESALNSLTEDALLQKRLLSRCPMPLTQADIFHIYNNVFYGKK